MTGLTLFLTLAVTLLIVGFLDFATTRKQSELQKVRVKVQSKDVDAFAPKTMK